MYKTDHREDPGRLSSCASPRMRYLTTVPEKGIQKSKMIQEKTKIGVGLMLANKGRSV